MESEKVKEIKELLRCMNGEKACTNCYINEVAQEQETCCINVVADMTLDLINELESENERLKKDNELLRNAKVVYENVDYCYEDLKKAENRIVELEKENAIKNDTIVDLLKKQEFYEKEKLTKFSERLKEKFYYVFGNEYEQSVSGFDTKVLIEHIDETLKEFI